ncbi:MAG: endonuclease III [Candidatus Bathyarchaeota archaeon]|nr:endonuclease III [Candidatus Bathyarchaeota archaeon]
MEERKRLKRIIKLLEKRYPDRSTALSHKNPLELLVATILSAQSTDRTVNKVTGNLFEKYCRAEDYADADLRELERDIKSTGFYRNKAKFLKQMGQTLVENFQSQVPKTMDELTTLQGVARKTANIVLWNAFGLIEGIAVDTHVKRLSKRLGLSENEDPNKIEKDLMELLPRTEWPKINYLLISHGREVCTARNPKCKDCDLNSSCPSAFTF